MHDGWSIRLEESAFDQTLKHFTAMLVRISG